MVVARVLRAVFHRVHLISSLHSSLSKLNRVVGAFGSIADIVNSITVFSLRTQLTAFLLPALSPSLFALTHTLSLVLTESDAQWTAATQRELSNQHSPQVFVFSEKVALLFHNLMVTPHASFSPLALLEGDSAQREQPL